LPTSRESVEVAMNAPVKLRAMDEEDLKVVSAYLQDAIVPISDMCFQPAEKRFVAVANRFMWETADIPLPPPALSADSSDAYPFQRIHTALRIENVTAVRSRGIDRRNRKLVLELLSLENVQSGIILYFAGGGCVRIDSPDWRMLIEDIGEPWPTGCKPDHRLDNTDIQAPSGGNGT